MRRVRIAQIGTSSGSHGNSIFRSLKTQSDVFEVVGFAFPEGEREKFPERMAEFEGYREMTVEEILNDPTIEAVTVETEELYLTDYALRAAECGKHIHMEKPGGISQSEFERLISTVKSKKTVFHTGYMYRYNPAINKLMEQIRRGELGEIISVEAGMNCRHPEKLRQWLKNFPGGMLFFLGCHLIDLVLQIQGAPMKIHPFSRPTGLDGVDADDFGMAVLEYPHGVSVVKTTAIEKGGFARRELVVTGTEKTVEIRPLEMYGDPELQFTTVTEYDSDDWGNRGTTYTTDQFNRYDGMMASFAAMVRGEKENPYTYDYESELHKTVLRCCGGYEDESYSGE